MSAALWFADSALALGDLLLVVVCVRQHVVLGAVTGIGQLPLLAFATSRGVSGEMAHAALGLALVLLILGTALLGLGRVLTRLLDDPPDAPDT